MAYPGRTGQHYQYSQGQGQAPQMPAPGYGPPQGYAPQGGYGSGYGAPPPQQQMGGYGPPPSQPPHQYGQPPSGPVGPPEYQNFPVTYNRPQGPQRMENGMTYEYSNMQGKRKALLVGVNYFGTRSELRGCINDVHNVKQFIQQRAGYRDDDMVILTDDQRDPRSIPTRENITRAMHWLVSNASPGDALFFHYSGHGSQAASREGDEADGYNETICPVDYERAGMIEDDEMHAIMVRPLPVGCRLTALFDSCHSGTALDLPYVYATSGNIKEPNVMAGVGKGLMGAAMSYARGDVMSMAKGLFSTFNEAKNTNSAEDYTRQHRSSGADVIMMSGCKDSQTSADATEAGKATGAMSWAFIHVLTQYPQLTYQQLLCATRDALAAKYSQKPQLSASHPIDMNMLFVL